VVTKAGLTVYVGSLFCHTTFVHVHVYRLSMEGNLVKDSIILIIVKIHASVLGAFKHLKLIRR